MNQRFSFSKVSMNHILFGLAFLLLPLASQVQATDFPEKPNVIFIITDDQHRESFGFLENKALTPNIDRMAREGIYFSQCYVAASVCTPSRYSCLTGQYASRCRTPRFLNGITPEGQTRVTWNINLAENQRILPHLLQQVGYKTGMVGKWHLGGISDRFQSVPPGSDPTNPEVAKILRENQENYCRALRDKYGWDYAAAVYLGNLDNDRGLRNTGLEVHNMEAMTQAGLEFIEDNQDQPFFLYFSTTLLHYPEVYKSLNADPRIGPAGLMEEPITGIQPSRESVLQRAAEAGVTGRAVEATWLDDGIGALIHKLEELGIAENTLVIYFNDHGMDYGGKGTCYQGGILTPTIAYWPGTIKPASEERLIQNVDFMPTILELSGAKAPADRTMDGRSLVPLFTREVVEWRSSIYSEIGYVRCVVTDDGWKYFAFRVPPSSLRPLEERMAAQLRYHERLRKEEPWRMEFVEIDLEARLFHLGLSPGGTAFEQDPFRPGAQEGEWHDPAPWRHNYFDPDQLYQISSDPLEITNLANHPAYTDKLVEMQDVLKSYLNELPGTFAELKP